MTRTFLLVYFLRILKPKGILSYIVRRMNVEKTVLINYSVNQQLVTIQFLNIMEDFIKVLNNERQN